MSPCTFIFDTPIFLSRLAPEEATVDEDGVQLGGKRAAILYAHRLREAAPAAVVDDEGEEAAKADGKTGGDEEKVSSTNTD